jgi:hypothetical protein
MEPEKTNFLEKYKAYRETGEAVDKARKRLLVAANTARSEISNLEIELSGANLESWKPNDACIAATYLNEWADAHLEMGRALAAQANGLRQTAEAAFELIEKAKESKDG